MTLRRRADRAQAAGKRAKGVTDFLRLGRADVGRAGGVHELLLVQRVVAAHQDQGEHAVQEVDQGLDLPVARGLVLDREILDRAHPRGGEGLGGGEQPGPFGIIDGGQPGRGLLDVRGVTALRAQDDEVLAGG